MYKSKCVPITTDYHSFCIFHQGDENQFIGWLSDICDEYGNTIALTQVVEGGLVVSVIVNDTVTEKVTCKYGCYIDYGDGLPCNHYMSEHEFDKTFADCAWM